MSSSQSYSFGDTYLIGPNTVHAFRFGVNRVRRNALQNDFFSWCDAGVSQLQLQFQPDVYGALDHNGRLHDWDICDLQGDNWIPTEYALPTMM